MKYLIGYLVISGGVSVWVGVAAWIKWRLDAIDSGRWFVA